MSGADIDVYDRPPWQTSGRRGVVIGKMQPLHVGHQHLLEFAASMCSELTVIVCSVPGEPIDGTWRYRWTCRLLAHHGHVRVVHHDAPAPQRPDDHPDFWTLWRDIVRDHAGTVDLLVASDLYGRSLARMLDAAWLPLDHLRTAVPVTGRDLIVNPYTSDAWGWLAWPTRIDLALNVAVVGGESCGKTTLARALATELDTVCAPEWARELLVHHGPEPGPDREIYELIVASQAASVDALASVANRLTVADTDAETTSWWSSRLTGSISQDLQAAVAARRGSIDLYLHATADGISFEPDDQRYGDGCRQLDDQTVRAELAALDVPVSELAGPHEARLATALAAVTARMADGALPGRVTRPCL